MKRTITVNLIVPIILVSYYCTGHSTTQVLKGPYLGQEAPGMTPQIFAPGIVSTEKNEHSPAIFSEDGNDLFWSYYSQGEHTIMYMRQVDGNWTSPEIFVYGSDLKDGNPFFSSDGTKLIYQSGRREKREDGSLSIDFWYVERNNDKWTNARLLDFPPNSERWQLYGCQVSNGNFYYTSKQDEKSTEFQLHISRFNGTSWESGEPLPDIFNASPVNWTSFVSPDESYIIFSSDRGGSGDGYDACDLYISFNHSDAGWTDPVNMGDAINTDKIERFPWVSPDEKYFFFVRGFGDVYWVDAKVIYELKPEDSK